MNKLFTNNFITTNLYSKKSADSKIVSQMIYGDHFSIIKKKKNWWKIKIREDGYVGYIKKRNFSSNFRQTHKVSVLSANFYKYPNNKKKIGKISFGSKMRFEKEKNGFIRFDNKWIKRKSLKNISHKNKNIFSNIKIFKGVKYRWGGKSYKGIDCSALIQVFINYNNTYCPRDAKDQLKYFKKNVLLKNLKKNDLIYWKGHVGLAISKKKIIHAYGPKKKCVIMDISSTIKLIKKTAKLNILAIKRIS